MFATSTCSPALLIRTRYSPWGGNDLGLAGKRIALFSEGFSADPVDRDNENPVFHHRGCVREVFLKVKKCGFELNQSDFHHADLVKK
jgi:hypothetical protein